MSSQPKSTIKSYFETLHKEEWRLIPSHEPYEASSLGRIRNKNKKILIPVRWGNRGHVAVKVGGGRKASKKYIHRLVLMAFYGPPTSGRIACHRNDVKTDNRLKNLYWGTYSDNAQDSIRLGTFRFDNLNTTKYSEDLIKNILSEYIGKRGEQSALAKKYGMSVSNIHLIVHKKSRVI